MHQIQTCKLCLILIANNLNMNYMVESKVAMKLVPDRKKFMEVIGNSDHVYNDIENFCSTFSPLLGEIHKFLVRWMFFIYLESFAWVKQTLCIIRTSKVNPKNIYKIKKYKGFTKLSL